MRSVKKRKKRKAANDFREFVFTASGADTVIENLSQLDLFDNLASELDRLAAVTELMQTAQDFDARQLSNLALVLKDIQKRMKLVLALGTGNEEPKE